MTLSGLQKLLRSGSGKIIQTLKPKALIWFMKTMRESVGPSNVNVYHRSRNSKSEIDSFLSESNDTSIFGRLLIATTDGIGREGK